MSKLLEVGQGCWLFLAGAGGPWLVKGMVDERNEHQRLDFSAPMGRCITTTYKVQWRNAATGNLSTTGWIDRVYATKEEAIASLGGGE